MSSKYRGIGCLKSPFDMVIYLQLFSREVPRTVIEIGTRFGGSAFGHSVTCNPNGWLKRL